MTLSPSWQCSRTTAWAWAKKLLPMRGVGIDDDVGEDDGVVADDDVVADDA